VLSPDGSLYYFRLSKSATGSKSTIVPNYVTESGFTEDIPARTKVGAPAASYEYFVYQIAKDTFFLSQPKASKEFMINLLI
jgi:hypothetical protein